MKLLEEKILTRKVLFEKSEFFWGFIPENRNMIMLFRNCKKGDLIYAAETGAKVKASKGKNYLEYYFSCSDFNCATGFVVPRNMVKVGYIISKKEEEDYLSGKVIFAYNNYRY